MNEIEGFGTPNLDGRGGDFAQETKLKDGDNVFWIVGPVKSCIPNGIWGVKAGKHWGYERRSKKDKTKTYKAPFRCLRVINFDTKMIEVDDAECAKNDKIKKKLEDAEIQLKAQKNPDGSPKYSEDDVKTRLAPLAGYLKAHNCDWKYYLNAMDQSGKFWVLLLSPTTYGKLKAWAKKQATEKGINIFSPVDGAWVNIVRTGTNPQVTDTPNFVTETVKLSDGSDAEKISRVRLSAEKIKECLARCVDLNNYLTVLSPEQITLLANSDGSPDFVDKVFAMGTRGGQRQTAPSAPQDFLPPKDETALSRPVDVGTTVGQPTPPTPLEPTPPIVPAAAVTQAATPVPAPVTPEPEIDLSIDGLAPVTPNSTPASAPTINFADLANVPNQDFLKQFNL